MEHTLGNLEQSCHHPGSWLIEGFRVKRIKPQLWLILNPPKKGQRLQFQSLHETRNWIVNELNGVHE